MAVECYAMVRFVTDEERGRRKVAKGLARRMRNNAWVLNSDPIIVSREGRLVSGQHRTEQMADNFESVLVEDRGIEYHLCKLTLVQPPPRGKSVPKPKWEVVEDLLTMSEDDFNGDGDATRFHHALKNGEALLDPFDDALIEMYDETDGRCYPVRKTAQTIKEALLIRVQDYARQWKYVLTRYMRNPKTMHRGRIRAAYWTSGIPWLPHGHAIDDRRIQLRQIRYLYPETSSMPLNIALDYVRDKL